MVMNMKEEIYCAKCNLKMRETVIPTYEYVEGIPLHNVNGYKCPRCGQLYFTEDQADELERLTNQEKKRAFTFTRKISYAGRSLVINLPEDLVSHMHITKGNLAKLTPIDKKRFVVEV